MVLTFQLGFSEGNAIQRRQTYHDDKSEANLYITVKLLPQRFKRQTNRHCLVAFVTLSTRKNLHS